MVKILIVDDSLDLLEALSAFLQKKGYKVKTVSTGEMIKTVLSEFEPDVLLLDVNLGGHDGRKLCKEIKEQINIKLPVILFSASPDLLRNYEECNADAVIEKPFDINTVIKKINMVLHQPAQQ